MQPLSPVKDVHKVIWVAPRKRNFSVLVFVAAPKNILITNYCLLCYAGRRITVLWNGDLWTKAILFCRKTGCAARNSVRGIAFKAEQQATPWSRNGIIMSCTFHATVTLVAAEAVRPGRSQCRRISICTGGACLGPRLQTFVQQKVLEMMRFRVSVYELHFCCLEQHIRNEFRSPLLLRKWVLGFQGSF